MNHILFYAINHAYNYKTNKSIYNILIGKKSHQTFFDASSQQLLSLYHSLPNLKYPTFERFILQMDDFESKFTIKTNSRYTYDSLIQTFSCIQLLIQTLSHTRKQSFKFVPAVQNTFIQQKVKQLYSHIKTNHLEEDLIKEIYLLFETIQKKHNTNYLHYYLQGYDEPMYTRQQISLIEEMKQSELFEIEMVQLIDLIEEIEHESRYPILSQTVILPPLLNQTYLSYQKLRSGVTMKEIAERQNVKINTVEDHVLEIFIKGYQKDHSTYIEETRLKQFVSYYNNHKGLRLREYKNEFADLTYFQIKLVIVGIERGDLNARG
ncbi:helix-turn-helix domain-containing protein [Staphylococcus caprae]|uniref:helix-turn-helix domain-containing protein n=1 Tax=Staphylococcus caprae TaxID=29380 RepID=UPI001F577456|nr:helix-turn-helix domain-containing protein [Staphylococcus caprae]MCI2953889.1 helix-turn-helix domain-containing protein [Staphylococcus caprae]